MQLEADTDVATAGNFQLRWSAEGPVEIEESADPEFASARVIYVGSDQARVQSGMPDGTWFYRARAAGAGQSSWSEPVHVTVRHHSLERAFGFFALGAAVFAMTLALIMRGARRSS